MQEKLNKKAFTFVELIVVTVILAILGAIWFASYSWYISSSRDWQRKSDMALIFSSMKLYKKTTWSLPIPADYFSISYSWSSNIVAWQWKLSSNVWLSTLDKIPLDPKLEIPYLYSFTKNRQEFQVAWTLENDWDYIAIEIWNYKSVAKTILPTLIIATWATSNVDIKDSENRKLFIFDKWTHNLPYNFDWQLEPISDWSDFDINLNEAIENKTFVQNSSFESCDEIEEAWKSIWDWVYQIRTSTWSLKDENCTF